MAPDIKQEALDFVELIKPEILAAQKQYLTTGNPNFEGEVVKGFKIWNGRSVKEMEESLKEVQDE